MLQSHREDEGTSDVKKKILDKLMKNKFKMEVVDVPHSKNGLPNHLDF